jgi:hypothetical protein
MPYAIRHRKQIQAVSGLDVVAGIWLLISPWVLRFASHAASAPANDVVFGVMIAALALIRASGAYDAAWISWVNAVLGLWVMISPWVLGYAHNRVAMWDNVIVGMVVIVLACWSALATESEMGDSERDRRDVR